MSEGINIEVIGKYKERYPAKIHSFSGENELIVKFNDCPDILCKIPLASISILLDNNDSKASDYQVGCEILVLRKLDDSITNTFHINGLKLTQAYWPGKIDKLKGCFAAIHFIIKDNEICNDIVELSSLRLMNDRRPLLKNDIHIHEIMVPDDLIEFCEHYDIRGDLNRWCGSAIIVNFDKVNKKLQIFSTDQEVVRKASLLDASFMRLLRQKKLVHSQKDELTKKLHDSTRNQFVEEFTVCDELMGLAIGHLGCNIKRARDIEGVINIDLNDHTHTFIISGETREACKAARAQLEYQQKILYVPMDIVSKVIGKSGNQIQDIINQSGINRVKVVEGADLDNWIEEENKHMLTDHVPFIFSGSAGSLSDAQLLLEFSIENFREMDKLQKERDDIQREIRNSQMPSNSVNKLGSSHSTAEREDEHFNNWPARGYNSGGRNRGRNNYRPSPSSDVDQRNDSYNDDQTANQTKYRGSSNSVNRGAPFRRGGGNFRQDPQPPVQNGQPKGNRRYQQYDDDTEDYTPVPTSNESENGRGGYNNRYRGNKSRGNRGGSRGNNSNVAQNNHPKSLTPTPTKGSLPTADSDQHKNGHNNQAPQQQQQHNHHQEQPAENVEEIGQC